MSFWASKLNGTTPPPTPLPSRDLFGLYNPVPQQVQQRIEPQQQEYTPSVRMTRGSICPDCNSDKYPAPISTVNGPMQGVCPECGFHPRFDQQGRGVRVLSEPGVKVQAAKQLDNQGTSLKGQIAQLNANQHNNISNVNQ